MRLRRAGANLQNPLWKALGRIPNIKYLLMFQRYGMRKFTAYDSARTVTKVSEEEPDY
jgi:hypothetical protein